MEDVLTRRFRNYLRERDEGAQTGKRFSYPPNLLLIDGGKGQLNVAVRVLELQSGGRERAHRLVGHQQRDHQLRLRIGRR